MPYHGEVTSPSPAAVSQSFDAQVSVDSAVCGRYAPSPSGDLHLGNLRTALLAWLLARTVGGKFVMRVEDLDRVKAGAAEQQLKDLQSLGIDWDGEVLYQSTRVEAYQKVIDELSERGLTYECFCTRKEIQAATSAPHAAPGAYPGTCRSLTESERTEKRRVRPPAIRLKSQVSKYTVIDDFFGAFTGDVDDFVLLRNDGTAAYNLAVVIDDHFQEVTRVVRGNDLLPSAPRQAYLANLLGFKAPRYQHVPLALNSEGQRLAKRDGAVTLEELRTRGVSDETIFMFIADSIPLAQIDDGGTPRSARNLQEMFEVFDPAQISLAAWIVDENLLKGILLNG